LILRSTVLVLLCQFPEQLYMLLPDLSCPQFCITAFCIVSGRINMTMMMMKSGCLIYWQRAASKQVACAVIMLHILWCTLAETGIICHHLLQCVMWLNFKLCQLSAKMFNPLVDHSLAENVFHIFFAHRHFLF